MFLHYHYSCDQLTNKYYVFACFYLIKFWLFHIIFDISILVLFLPKKYFLYLLYQNRMKYFFLRNIFLIQEHIIRIFHAIDDLHAKHLLTNYEVFLCHQLRLIRPLSLVHQKHLLKYLILGELMFFC